jgi:hypothetical protein
MLSIVVKLPVQTRDSIAASANLIGELSAKRNAVGYVRTGVTDVNLALDPFMSTAQAQTSVDALLNAVQNGVVSVGSQQIKGSEGVIQEQARVETGAAVNRLIYPIVGVSLAISGIAALASLAIILRR